LDEGAAEALDQQLQQLLRRVPQATALRVDAEGAPEQRMDVYSRPGELVTERAVRDLLSSFSLHSSETPEVSPEGVASHTLETPAELDARTIVLDGQRPPLEEPVALYFDADAGVAVAFRTIASAVPEITCSGATSLYLHRTMSTGASASVYFYADMITASVAADRGYNSDPDLYLYYKNGSAWTSIASSTYASYMDTVAAYNTACAQKYWRVRVYAYTGGYYSLAVTRFTAN
jgi:hypothetical protein